VTAQKLPAASVRLHKGQFDQESHFDRGAAAVEMALVMPLLILMVMGIIDFGRIFNGEIQLSQAAREGARVAALGNFTVTNVIDRTKAALANPAFQGSLSFGTTGKLADCPTTPVSTSGCIVVGVVPVDSTGPAAADGKVCAATDALTGNSQVTVTIPYSKILFGPAKLSQTAVMKCSG